VPDLTHDTAEDGFHEIQLSGKQLVFLFMATTVASVVIFLCGVLVGRGVGAEARSGAPIGAVDEGVKGPDAVPESLPPTPADAEKDLSYQERLTAETIRKEVPKPQPDPEPQEPAPAAKPEVAQATPPPAAAAAGVPTSPRPGTWYLQVTALSSQAAAADLVRQLAAKGYPAWLQNPAPGTPALYRVRVGRFKSRADADAAAGQILKEEQLKAIVSRD
jgi:DedD protein